VKEGKIKVKEFEKFPEIITLSEELPQEFNKNYYSKNRQAKQRRGKIC